VGFHWNAKTKFNGFFVGILLSWMAAPVCAQLPGSSSPFRPLASLAIDPPSDSATVSELLGVDEKVPKNQESAKELRDEGTRRPAIKEPKVEDGGAVKDGVSNRSSSTPSGDSTASQSLSPNFGDSLNPFGSGLSSDFGGMSSAISGNAFSETDALSTGLNFNEFPKEFQSGLFLRNDRWAMKIGGYVKADLNRDFNPIDSTDSFNPATIPIGAPSRTNSRFHARQTRLNMDARWISDSGEPLRMLVEGDFFGVGETLRLRHAYGEYGNFIIGQTWTTFTHRAALPNTLDSVGDVASVGRRQAQVRYTRKWMDGRWAFGASVENALVTADDELNTFGTARTPFPDGIVRLRYSVDRGQFQIAALGRRLGFQPNDREVILGPAGGLNGTGFFDITKRMRLYGGILWGQGIGSYRDLPDFARVDATSGEILPSIAWYSGLTHQWNDRWSSNLTFSEGQVDNAAGQAAESINRLQYLAVNLIWQPSKYTFVGTEYLWGTRRDYDMEVGQANRLMVSFGFLFP